MTIPTPPRLSGNAAADVSLLQDWAFGLYQAIAIGIIQPLQGIAKLEDDADLAAVRAKVNEILDAVGE